MTEERVQCAHLEPIPAEECRRLLATHHLGRLAVLVDDAPRIFPVNYGLVDDGIVFCSGGGNKVEAARRGRVAFEIDDSDPLAHTGWSVVAVGSVRELDQRAVGRIPVAPWCGGDHEHWLRIDIDEISGRRIVRHIP